MKEILIMKKIVSLILCSLLLFSTGCYRKQTVLPLSETEINEAIKFGIDNTSLTNTEFVAPWTLASGGYMKGEGTVTLMTPFIRIALMSKKCAVAGEKLDRRMIKSLLLKESGFIHFEITLYGDTYGFARTVNFSLIHDGKEYKPVAQFMPSYADMGRDYTCIATGWAKFKKDNIPDDATIRLSIKFKTNEKNEDVTKLDFNFNLKEFR